MDPISEPTSPWPRRLGIIAGALGVLFIIGLVGQLSGAGWFGYRTFLYDNVEIYLLNLSDAEKRVRIPGHEEVVVKPQGAEIVTTVGGTISVEIVGEETFELSVGGSDALVKLAPIGCLAATDITPYYGGEQPKDPRFNALLKPEQRTYIVGSKNVVWPRKTFPKKLTAGDGDGVWVELVGCDLFEDETMLDAYVVFRLQERMKKAMEAE